MYSRNFQFRPWQKSIKNYQPYIEISNFDQSFLTAQSQGSPDVLIFQICPGLETPNLKTESVLRVLFSRNCPEFV